MFSESNTWWLRGSVIVQFLVFVVVAGGEELRYAEEDLFTAVGHGR
jgi:hypothetical protein